MGAPSRRGGGERAVFLQRSRFHVFYKVYEETNRIRVVRIRHEKQRPLK
jgi:plasmid stabilization system protein ParE